MNTLEKDLQYVWHPFTQMQTAEDPIVIEKGEGDKIYNTNIFIDPNGNILSTHRKAHLYTPLDEHLVFSSGNKFTVTKTPWGNIGIMILD